MQYHSAFATEFAQVSRRWRARLDRRLKHTGLTQTRWVTLLFLSRAGGRVTQRELADQAGIEESTLVRLLNGLQAQGLIERSSVEDDRRAKHVLLTPAGQAMLEEIHGIAAELRGELLADVDSADLTACLRVLQKMGGRLDQR